MTRRSSFTPQLTRQRRTAGTSKRFAGDPGAIHKLGFTCFRLVSADDPEITFAFRRLRETRATMGVFAARL